MLWSRQQRAFAVEAYSSNGPSVIAVQREFICHFDIPPRGHVPDRKCVSMWNDAFRATENVFKEMSAQTVRDVLHSAGLKARTPRRKPYISEVNRKRSLEFAIKPLETPPQSPDLNPIENLWMPLDTEIRKKMEQVKRT
ncbi:DUF4817 domain-containing protein [Trichonephila clavipes]|nr:DUF4817 domain-containing protein [Trichonephila clavipes]